MFHGRRNVRIWKQTYLMQFLLYLQIFDTFLYTNSCTDGRSYNITITQESIIKDIAKKEDIDVATVRKIFKATEKYIFDYLSSATPTENTVVKLFNGLSIESRYIEEQEKNAFDHFICNSKIWAKPKITRYYNRKLNGYLN